MALIYILIALAIGLGIPLQTTVNSRLREFVTYPFLASLVAFGMGAIFLLLLSSLTGDNVWIPTTVFLNEPWWIWLGGALGVLGLTANILIFPHIGSVQTVIIPMLGQIITGIAIDHFGWFNSPHIPFTYSRAVGVILILAGVFMVILLTRQPLKSKLTAETLPPKYSKGRWIWQTIGFAAGMLVAARSAINGQLGVVLESSVQSGLFSLITGTILLLILSLILRQSLHHIIIAVKNKAPLVDMDRRNTWRIIYCSNGISRSAARNRPSCYHRYIRTINL